MKKALIIIFAVVLILFSGCILLSSLTKGDLENIQNAEIDMDNVNDGEYDGHSELGPVVVDVRVVVRSHRIDNVELVRHDCGFGHKADAIVNRMVEQNTWNVDVISGATISSEIIKNAVNKALR
jgi:uncharacterized protein with FMN-binding domain